MIDRIAILDNRPYRFTVWCITTFVLFTLIAMLAYPGGTVDNTSSNGYQFTQNFFSDLGMTVAHSGAGNYVAAVLFFLALTGVGTGLIVYFLSAPVLFRAYPPSYILAWLGTIFGVISGLGYIGVAFTPANLYIDQHVLAVYVAFMSIPVAIIFYSIAIFLMPGYPQRYAAVYAAFTILLLAYLYLLFSGISNLTIQATGQKIIAYASLITMLYQARGVIKMLGEGTLSLQSNAAPQRAAQLSLEK